METLGVTTSRGTRGTSWPHPAHLPTAESCSQGTWTLHEALPCSPAGSLQRANKKKKGFISLGTIAWSGRWSGRGRMRRFQKEGAGASFHIGITGSSSLWAWPYVPLTSLTPIFNESIFMNLISLFFFFFPSYYNVPKKKAMSIRVNEAPLAHRAAERGLHP